MIYYAQFASLLMLFVYYRWYIYLTNRNRVYYIQDGSLYFPLFHKFNTEKPGKHGVHSVYRYEYSVHIINYHYCYYHHIFLVPRTLCNPDVTSEPRQITDGTAAIRKRLDTEDTHWPNVPWLEIWYPWKQNMKTKSNVI